MKTKTFDAVEMKRRASLRVYEKTKDLGPEEELEYWRKRYEEIVRLREHASKKRKQDV